LARLAGNDRMQPQHISALGDAQNNGLALGGVHGDLHSSLEYDKSTPCRILLGEQNRSLRIRSRVGDGCQRPAGFRRQAAQEPFAIRASCVILFEL